MKVRFQSRNYTHKKKHKTIKKNQLPYNKKSKNITSLEKKFIQEQT